MENLECGTISFNRSDIGNLDDVIRAVKSLRFSEQSGWEAFYRADYELQALKDFICKDCLKRWEVSRGKNRVGNKKDSKKVRGVRRSSRRKS